MRMLAMVWTTFRKELLDGSRDRRSISSLVSSAIISPLLFGLLFTVAAERRKSADDIDLPVQGAQYAPAFVQWLTQQSGVTIVPPPADAEKAVADRDADVVLIIDPDFEKDMARAVPAPVKLVSDVDFRLNAIERGGAQANAPGQSGDASPPLAAAPSQSASNTVTSADGRSKIGRAHV